MPEIILHARASENWGGLSVEDIQQGIRAALRERYDETETDFWTRELFEDSVIVEVGGESWRFGFSVGEDGAVSVDEEGERVRQVWVPAGGEMAAQEGLSSAAPPRSSAGGGGSGRRGADGEGRRVQERHQVRALEQRADGNWDVEFIAHGMTADGQRYYSRQVLEAAAAAGIYDGAKMYINHQHPGQGPPHRDLRDWVSTILPGTVRVTETGLAATIHAHHPDALTILQDEVARAHVGLSQDVYLNERPKRIDGRVVRAVESITKCLSVDWVPEGNAHGRVLEAVTNEEPHEEDDSMSVDLSSITLDDLREARPDLVEAAQAEVAGTQGNQVAQESHEQQPGEGDARVLEIARQASDEVVSLRRELALRDQRERVQEVLAESDLPAAARRRVTEGLSQELIDAEQLPDRIAEAVEAERGYIREALQGMGLGTRVTGAGETATEADKRAQEAYEEAWERRCREQGMSAEEIKQLKAAVGR